MLIKFLHSWQELIGACLGVILPIAFGVIATSINNSRKFKERLFSIEKDLLINLNIIADIRETLLQFLYIKLTQLISDIETRGPLTYSIDLTFFPLFMNPEVTTDILSQSTRSNYVENKILQVSVMSKTFGSSINDLRGQFFSTLELNHKMAFEKYNDAAVQNLIYITNIKEFIKVAQHDLIDTNIRIYVNRLIEAKAAVKGLQKLGLLRWRLKFPGRNLKYFKSLKDFKTYSLTVEKRIDEYLAPFIDEELGSFNIEFKAQDKKYNPLYAQTELKDMSNPSKIVTKT
jgi:hypothetical protein